MIAPNWNRTLARRSTNAWMTAGVLLILTFTPIQPLVADEGIVRQFDEQIQPLLARYCNDCHSGEAPEAKLDTSLFLKATDVSATWGTWQEVVSRVHEREMPPADASPQPTDEERKLLQTWTESFRQAEAKRMRNDPGPVSTRRLSNAEFNYTIRDLTGVDIQPTKSFPVDPANSAALITPQNLFRYHLRWSRSTWMPLVSLPIICC